MNARTGQEIHRREEEEDVLESERGGTTSLHIFRDEIVLSVIWYIVHLCSHNKIVRLGNL